MTTMSMAPFYAQRAFDLDDFLDSTQDIAFFEYFKARQKTSPINFKLRLLGKQAQLYRESTMILFTAWWVPFTGVQAESSFSNRGDLYTYVRRVLPHVWEQTLSNLSTGNGPPDSHMLADSDLDGNTTAAEGYTQTSPYDASLGVTELLWDPARFQLKQFQNVAYQPTLLAAEFKEIGFLEGASIRLDNVYCQWVEQLEWVLPGFDGGQSDGCLVIMWTKPPPTDVILGLGDTISANDTVGALFDNKFQQLGWLTPTINPLTGMIETVVPVDTKTIIDYIYRRKSASSMWATQGKIINDDLTYGNKEDIDFYGKMRVNWIVDRTPTPTTTLLRTGGLPV